MANNFENLNTILNYKIYIYNKYNISWLTPSNWTSSFFYFSFFELIACNWIESTLTFIMRDPEESFSFFQLFRFASRFDWFLLSVGMLATIIKSTIHPIIVIIYTDIIAMIIERLNGQGTTPPTYIIPLFGGGKVL